jgi:hypothetical protein
MPMARIWSNSWNETKAMQRCSLKFMKIPFNFRFLNRLHFRQQVSGLVFFDVFIFIDQIFYQKSEISYTPNGQFALKNLKKPPLKFVFFVLIVFVISI